MTTKTKQQAKKIPKLRFPEFGGEWKEKRLGEIVEINKGKQLNKIDLLENGQYPSYSGGIEPSGYTNQWNTSKNTIIISEGGNSCGYVNFITKNFWAGGHCYTLEKLKPNINKIFLYQFLKYSERLIMRLRVGSGLPNIQKKDLLRFKIFAPSISEQQKIASFLSAVDERIEILRAKREALEKYKKGIMQKIFPASAKATAGRPAKDEKVPEIRFKDDNGKDFPEWEEKKIEDIFEITRGYVLSTKEMSEKRTEEYKYPVYSSQTKENGLIGYYKEYLYENAITWTTDGANAGEVKYRKGKFYCTNVCGVLLNNKGYANQCIAEILNLVTRKYVSYVGNPKLMNNTMSKIKIKVPSLPEQQKIANFLSAIDKKIELIDAQIQKMQEWKRGLMQGLFV